MLRFQSRCSFFTRCSASFNNWATFMCSSSLSSRSRSDSFTWQSQQHFHSHPGMKSKMSKAVGTLQVMFSTLDSQSRYHRYDSGLFHYHIVILEVIYICVPLWQRHVTERTVEIQQTKWTSHVANLKKNENQLLWQMSVTVKLLLNKDRQQSANCWRLTDTSIHAWQHRMHRLALFTRWKCFSACIKADCIQSVFFLNIRQSKISINLCFTGDFNIFTTWYLLHMTADNLVNTETCSPVQTHYFWTKQY